MCLIEVLVWGGISWKGPTNLVVLDGSCRVDAVEYCKILRDGYVEWERENFGGKSLLVQDNAPCHKANITKEFLKREEIETEDWPAESPDLNPVELVWGEMKRYLKTTWKPTNVPHLVEGINEFWTNVLTADKCQNYIRHVHTQMRRVIEVDGKPVKD
ncbi:hypothetical protein PMAYCL1PPCAC_25981 [Pristionchus mayeri]|uniref:Tc1-like transposase DDE domain-containing protein n=1 Tax=Pristionchus mayeri TaxID=1317129 RepID=A0AAN5D3C8_9BILA|nr:hypothetical protein PMAYCL1PPCAC_04891 [Pristionchus mayeri]GMR39798.1 hypothetical protein PMAYCL1PPCAC_09993 [Pristionchus mayeri]GMR50377.1 hypothetical protein PMAYCL1PPCAC_20572 [Pristionchus mayeri]GMR50705.1 hypothetical protein PMAYCL1PPCAC_20900 [Pristionchus mayeri]GMR55624.1 hypothetical protein PMAYCL1PPCAC_25819 [Pristionchus mayeri]